MSSTHLMIVVGCRLRSKKGSAAASISPANIMTEVVPSPTCNRAQSSRSKAG